MINERRRLIWRRMQAGAGIVAAQRHRFEPSREEPMTGGMTAFMMAVGGTSLACYLLMTRVQNRSARRNSAGDGSGNGSSSDAGGSGWSMPSWFGGAVPRRTIRAHRATAPAGTVGAGTAVEATAAAAINAVLRLRAIRALSLCHKAF
jgi:hypothetical protein